MSIPQTPSPLSNILAAKTYNAAWFSGSTKELQITAAIAAAVLDGALYVFVPANMLPYTASSVTFNNAVRMLREGSDPTTYDVRAYGATGNNIVDDTVAVQAAFNAAAAANSRTSLGGNSLSYKITSPLTVTCGSFFMIDSDGAKLSSTIVDDGSSKIILKIIGNTLSRVTLKSFTLEHTYVSGDTLAGLIITPDVQRLYAENVSVSGVPYYGIDSQAFQQTWVNARVVSNRHAGMSLSGGGSNVAIDCDVSSNGVGNNTEGYGLLISGKNTVVLGGKFLNNDRYGIDLRRADNVVVNGAYVYNSGYIGIYGVNEDSDKDAKNQQIINCTVDMNNRVGSSHCIWVGAFSNLGTASYNEGLVAYNTLKNGLDKGVLVSGGTGTFGPEKVQVTGNKMESIVGAAIDIGGSYVIKAAIVDRNILKQTGNIIVSNVVLVYIAGNERYLTSGNASNFVAVTSDSYTIIKDNISDAVYTDKPFTWTATRFVVKDNIAIYGPVYRELVQSKTAIPDNSATTFLTISVPNIEIGGLLLIDYLINDTDKGDLYRAGQLIIQIARYPGVAAQVSVAHSIPSQTLSTASGWGRAIVTTFTTAVSGAVGATNTVDIKVTNDTSDNLTSEMRYNSRFLLGGKLNGAIDMTMVAV